MTDHTTPSLATSNDLLATTRALTRKVRRAQRGAWFPLALFGLATLASVPFNRYGTSRTCSARTATGYVCSVYSTWSLIYWPVVLVLLYIAIAWFYARRSRERGVGTRVKPYVVAGIIVAMVLTAVSIWLVTHPTARNDFLGLHVYPGSPLHTAIYRLVSPAAAIGLALLVLARIERNVALLIFTLGYLAIVLFLFPATRSHTPAVPHATPWFFLPRLLVDAGVLLLGSAVFALADRRNGRSTP
jgi:hypothetical protein